MPFSSAGPFQEVELTGLQAGATYHYSIGGGVDHTFTTAPTGSFRFDVIADIGSSRDYSNVLATQNQVAADNPAFVLVPGRSDVRGAPGPGCGRISTSTT